MYAFLRSRRWIVASFVVTAAVVTIVELGFWQLRRLHAVREQNASVRAALAMPTAPIEEVLGSGLDAGRAVYRRVEATGAYDAGAEIMLGGRSFEGRPGNHVLTPFDVEGGRALVVDRGWVPLDPTEVQRGVIGPPAGRVRVGGVLFRSERRGPFAAAIPSGERLQSIPRVDVPRIAEQLGRPTYPLYLRLESQVPPQNGDLPVPPGLPDLSEGPHLAYAVQWFIFATLAVLTFLALIRRTARRAPSEDPV